MGKARMGSLFVSHEITFMQEISPPPRQALRHPFPFHPPGIDKSRHNSLLPLTTGSDKGPIY